MRLLCVLLLTCCAVPVLSQTVNVFTAVQLQNALANAVPGQTIVMADGVYNAPVGNIGPPIGVNGTPTQPITLMGSKRAVLTIADSAHGYGIWLQGNAYWILKGFTTRYCKNGVMIDSSHHIIVDDVTSVKNGQSGINLRTYSSYCTVQNCYVDSCGILDKATGEGIYIGSAYSNWCTNTACNPDTCNYNQILYNSFGEHIAAENIDIKEGTKGGLIRGNTFNGKGLANQNGGDSWIDVKGNYYTIELNTGYYSFEDGFQTHIQLPGYGNNNVFNKNTLYVNGGTGRGIYVVTVNSVGTALNNVVCNNNIVSGAAMGLTNVATQACTPPAALPLLFTQLQLKPQHGAWLLSWAVDDVTGVRSFIVEQSEDGAVFKLCSTLNAVLHRYVVALPASQVKGSYYRVKALYSDGQFVYSSVVKAKDLAAVQVKQLGRQFSITTAGGATLRLTNMAGASVCVQSLAGGNNVQQYPVPTGVYLLEVISSDDVYRSKVYIP
jgi:hypothetical protein